jgi:hypothetical protein
LVEGSTGSDGSGEGMMVRVGHELHGIWDLILTFECLLVVCFKERAWTRAFHPELKTENGSRHIAQHHRLAFGILGAAEAKLTRKLLPELEL